MSNLSFSFDKPYDEIEINKENFKVYYDDDSLRKYQEQALKYQKEVKKYLKKQQDIENMTEPQRKKVEEEGFAFMKDFIETFYGEGSYEKIYAHSGKSMINMVPLVEFTFEWLDSKVPDTNRKKKDYYTKKRKK